MKGILIFDHLNDILFTKCNKKFADHIQKMAKDQGLINENKDEYLTHCQAKISPNIIIQLFSPIITSQQLMASQFGNSYTSMKCQNGINMVFDEYMGYKFIYIATEKIELMRRTLGICISIVRHLCGPIVSILKTSKEKVRAVSLLLDAWSYLRQKEQCFLTETVEQLTVNSNLATETLKILNDASEMLKAQSEFSNIHVLVLVEHKFLSLYSSKNAQDLIASDILMMILLCHVANRRNKQCDNYTCNVGQEETFIIQSNNEENGTMKHACQNSADAMNLVGGLGNSPTNEILPNVGDESTCTGDVLYRQLVLLGSEETGHTANAIHISELAKGINLVTIVEVTNVPISSGLYDSFFYLNFINGLQLLRDIEELRPAYEHLETAIKKVNDGIKKNRININSDVDLCQRRLQVKWEFIRKKYSELIKSRDPELILQIEANVGSFLDALKDLLNVTCFNDNFLEKGNDAITVVSRHVARKLNDFSDFLKVKALKNFTLGSRTSLTINKYLEEFPGLVHFIYIDRTTHRLTTPTIDFSNPETLSLTTNKIWEMVEQSRIHMSEGHISVMWKDATFSYAYFLWFEDSSGSPLKCKPHLNHSRNFPVPGILYKDYYRKLAEMYFPKLSPNKIRIYELYCVHLGLATSSCILEHSRRLAATIWEVNGMSNNPVDIL